MKTKNNVQKAILKSLAVVISLVLLSVTVNAQSFWKTILENNSFNEIAIAMTETGFNTTKLEASSSTDANAFAALLETEIESPMELEEWMTDATYFDSNVFSVEQETEESLELESWMTDNNYFDINTFSIEQETEEALELEDWMINFGQKNSDNKSNFSYEQETEKELNLEPWMVKENYWN